MNRPVDQVDMIYLAYPNQVQLGRIMLVKRYYVQCAIISFIISIYMDIETVVLLLVASIHSFISNATIKRTIEFGHQNNETFIGLLKDYIIFMGLDN